MATTSEIKQKMEELLQPLLEAQGTELVDLELHRPRRGKTIVRLFLDRPEGITLGEIARVSRMVGDLLEVYDLIPESYHLEVSSPGLTRELKKPGDYRRSIGRLVRITTRHALEGRQVFRGILQTLEDDAVCLKEGETVYRLPLPEIARARLDLDMKKNLKGDKDLS